MAKRLKFFNAILCEHVVAGANNKHTLINVYSGNIIVDQMPAALTFGLYVEMAAGLPPKMDVEIQLDGKAIAKIAATFSHGITEQPSTLAVPMVQVGVDRDLVLSIVAFAEGHARTTLLEKRIYQGEVVPTSPTASPPPSSQSQPGVPAS